MNNRNFSENVRKVCDDYLSIVIDSGLFSNQQISSMRGRISKDILSLLRSPKPKIMVYGIYNSGKSTLVNAICRRAAAEVADRPTTSKIAEYDAGKYILVDSPGVNAPMEHEEIADSHINSCHIILFVISSKGIFEDKVNYEKMFYLINKDIPFYIVLNDRGTALPPGDEELRRKLLAEHENELNAIKEKIIKNLIKISGRNDIGDRYEVIVLNAKRAWLGVEKAKDELINKSNIFALTSAIEKILEGKGALKQLLAPLSAIEELIVNGEKILLSQTVSSDLALKREMLQMRMMDFREKFIDGIRGYVEMYFNDLYNSYLGRGSSDINLLAENIAQEINENYKRLISPVAMFIRENFAELNIKIDNECRISTPVISSGENLDAGGGDYGRENNYSIKGAGTETGNEDESEADDFSLTEALTPAVAGTLLPIPGGTAGGAIITILKVLKHLSSSSARREQAEFERARREADAYNAEVNKRLEEDIRRRQDARTAANSKMNEITQAFRLEFANSIDNILNRTMQAIDGEIAKRTQRSRQINDMLKNLQALKTRVAVLRNEISI